MGVGSRDVALPVWAERHYPASPRGYYSVTPLVWLLHAHLHPGFVQPGPPKPVLKTEEYQIRIVPDVRRPRT